jgi:predicted RNase H-like nuclease (RuvC/YqgF family)
MERSDHFKITLNPTIKKNKKINESTNTDDLLTIEVEASALAGIHATLEQLYEEVARLQGSLEFSQSEILTLQRENKTLTTKVKIHDSNMDLLLRENRVMKESLLDIKSCSMREKYFFLPGIP